MKDLRNDKPLWGLGEVLKMSWPASLSMLSRPITQFVDGLMVSRLGPSTIAAQSVGALIAFVPESFAMGVLGVVSTYVSQNFGAGRQKRTGQYAWAGIFLASIFAAIIMSAVIFAGPLFKLIGHESIVQNLEVLYFRYMVAAAILTLPSRVLEQFFYGIHKPKVVFIASVSANGFNIIANYVLIFGMYGFPKLGLEGAAIGTVISWALQLGILLSFFLSHKIHEQYGSRSILAASLKQCKDIVRIGWPAGVQFCSSIFNWSIFTAFLIGYFGTVHLAAAAIAVRYMHLSFMPAIGISIATTAIVGKSIGQLRPDLARHRAHAALIAAVAYMSACGLAFLIFRHEMVELFVNLPHSSASIETNSEIQGQIIAAGGNIMLLAAVFQLFDAMGIVFSGALKGAGDTLWPMVVMIALNWTILIGGGVAMVWLLPQLESVGPYLAATAYVILFGIIMALRFESGAWRKIDLLGRKPKIQAD